MSDLKSTIKDLGMQVLSNLFKPASGAPAPSVESVKTKSLKDLHLDDLKREKIRIEQEERKMLERIKGIEDKKRAMFEQGTRDISDRERRVIARKIKDLDVESNNLDRMLQAFSKQMRIITGLTQVKERERVMAGSGMSDMLSDLDLQELIIYIDKASVDGEFQISKLDDLLGALEEADSLAPEMREEQDVLDIVAMMQKAHEAADSPGAIENQFNELTNKLEAKRTENKESERFDF